MTIEISWSACECIVVQEQRATEEDTERKEISDNDREEGRAGHQLQVYSYAWMTSLDPSSSPWEWAPWKQSLREQSTERAGGPGREGGVDKIVGKKKFKEV